ncbi:hypothetical protein HYH02_014699 [Chlamydomonas schloesseri]|uniref:Uncharacterized protein n=1 Tax=Chlamydomonas schloesseri TaxID=2026947 RepID=A0A835SVX2_9CHLO|nr:hypothetical protein HYH02_014699 [Chlamydomonas schloesseri]|eukprot:KAG2426846.1 hypothetical protein HYH02_014699 [Chlamydomonas schloesseri]
MSGDTFPPRLACVTSSGPGLSSLLYSVTAGGAPCDGLLFGDTITTTTSHMRDDDDTATVTECRAAISSGLCCAGTCSFYDAAGQLQESVLEDLCRQQPGPLLGWISHRPLLAVPSGGGGGGGTSGPGGFGSSSNHNGNSTSSSSATALMRPSMREAAVTQALLRRQLAREAAAGVGGGGGGQQQAVLLLLFGSGGDHNGATLTWQLRCFQARQAPSSGELQLTPVPLTTLNLGGHTGHGAYSELHAALGITSASSTTTLSIPSASAAAAPAPPALRHGWATELAAAGAGSSPGSTSSAAGPSPALLSSSPPPPPAGAAGGAARPPAAAPVAVAAQGGVYGSPAASGPGLGSPPQPSGASLSSTTPLTPPAPHPLLPALDPAALAALAAGSRAQVGAVKHHCEALLVGLHELCGQAVAGEAALERLRARRDALLAQLASATSS